MELNFDEFKSSGLHDKHSVATSKFKTILKTEETKKTCIEISSRTRCTLTSSQQSGKEMHMGDSLIFCNHYIDIMNYK
jgi:hypothetical protein